VIAGIAGLRIRWKSPPRADMPTDWLRAIQRHGVHTLIGLAWTAFVWWLEPRVLPWVLPVAGALILSVPLSVYSSRVTLGRAARRLRLFVTPEEVAPVPEILRTAELASLDRPRPGLTHAVVDPLANALACAQGTPRTHAAPGANESREDLVDRALRGGLAVLDARERSRLLNDPIALAALHLQVWRSPAAHASWRQESPHDTAQEAA